MLRLLMVFALLSAPITSAFALRVLEEVENSFELTLAEVQLPTSATGAVSFRGCDGCRATTLRVTTSTKYLIDGTEVALAELQRIAEELRQSSSRGEDVFTGVYFDLASSEVTRISIRRPRR